MPLDLLAGSLLGSLVGMRHALEPDHLAAVATLISRERSAPRAALLGACWGLGHTLALLVGAILLVGLRAEMPERLATLLELLVAVMLVGLGVRAIGQAVRQGLAGAARLHQHGRVVHVHGGVPSHVHVGTWTLARRPLLVGAIHGLAGSGALTALVIAALPSDLARVMYVGLFGLGSSIGMAALSGVLGWPLARLGTDRRFATAVSFLVGCTSMALGIAWGVPLASRLL
jgi:hypothetical protein